jgi:hypothetical protein
MSTETATIRGALVYRSHEYPHRLYDAFGENVTKYITQFQSLPADDTTTDPTEFVNTVVPMWPAAPCSLRALGTRTTDTACS